LLERIGEHTTLFITKGFGDALRIAYQNRPDIFALNIVLPELLYEQVIEVDERYSAKSEELKAVSLIDVRSQLEAVKNQAIDSIAIVFMHAYRYPKHEQQVAALARDLGFSQVSVSHEVSPLIKLISRGDTTVVDAYLSPILRRYVDSVASELGDAKLLFMQSNGGLTDAHKFQGKDAILSGPAGGYVGAVKTAALAGFDKIINFDMGGTSTDVSHYAGEYERDFETQVAGVRMRTPIMRIHTVAAGGGSIVHFDGSRFRVGPDSAGAKPGPVCYRQNGPLTITDCNVMLGKLNAGFFPKVFGKSGQEPLDEASVKQHYKLSILSSTYGEIRFKDKWHISFGVNDNKKVVMWLGDINELPENEQYYLLSENIDPQFNLHSEFYKAQIDVQYAEPSIENEAFQARNTMIELGEQLHQASFYKLEGEIARVIGNLQKPIFWEDKHVSPVVEALNRIFLSSIDRINKFLLNNIAQIQR
jgi:hypothetical protein